MREGTAREFDGSLEAYLSLVALEPTGAVLVGHGVAAISRSLSCFDFRRNVEEAELREAIEQPSAQVENLEA